MRRFTVRTSPVHGRGVFAVTRMCAGETILEYKGKLIAWKEAQRRYERSAAEDGHTFFFDLDDGRVIGSLGGSLIIADDKRLEWRAPLRKRLFLGSVVMALAVVADSGLIRMPGIQVNQLEIDLISE